MHIYYHNWICCGQSMLIYKRPSWLLTRKRPLLLDFTLSRFHCSLNCGIYGKYSKGNTCRNIPKSCASFCWKSLCILLFRTFFTTVMFHLHDKECCVHCPLINCHWTNWPCLLVLVSSAQGYVNGLFNLCNGVSYQWKWSRPENNMMQK